MERYLFTPDGYRCVDVDGTILHQSVMHEDLFQFVDKDNSSLHELLSKYLRACISIENLAPLNNAEKYDIRQKMSDILRDLHPFCTGEYLDREIALYLNDKLVEASSRRPDFSKLCEITEREYKAIFDSLFPNGFGRDGDINDENDYQHLAYYSDYRKRLNGENECPSASEPFVDLLRAQRLIKNFLYWVLDSQAAPFIDMNLPQRLYVYNAYHHPETFRIANTEVEYYWGNTDGIRFDGSSLGIRHDIPFTEQLPDGRCMAEVVQGIAANQDYQNVYPEAKKLLNQTIVEAKNKSKLDEYCAVYGIHNLFTLLFIECQRMYEAKVSIRRCERCGHYFIASKRMYKYCERLINEDSLQTCRDVGAKENAKRKLIDDPVYYQYNKAYRTHHARIRAGHITKQEFDTWAMEAKRRMNAVLEDPLLLDSYYDWLKRS